MRGKMASAVNELKEKADIFFGAKDAIEKKEAERRKMEAKLTVNTKLMYAYRLERDNLENRMFEAKDKIAELEKVNDTQSAQIAFVNNHEHERERSWLAEIDRNDELQKLLEQADLALFRNETTVLFGLKQTIEDQDLRIDLLAEDNKSKRDDLLLNKKLFQEKEKRKND